MSFELSKEEQSAIDEERNKIKALFLEGFRSYTSEIGMLVPSPVTKREEAYHKGEVAAEKVIAKAREFAKYDFHAPVDIYAEKYRPSQRMIYTSQHLMWWAEEFGLNYNLHFEAYCDRYDEAYYNELRVLAGLEAK